MNRTMDVVPRVADIENATTEALVEYCTHLKTFTNREICSLINMNHHKDLSTKVRAEEIRLETV